MGKIWCVPSLALLALLAGCAGIGAGRDMKGAEAAPQVLRVQLDATKQSTGRIGSATLVSRGDETAVTVLVSGVPYFVTRPVHLYTYIHGGRCGALDSTPAYRMTDRVLASAVGRPLALAATRGPFEVGDVVPVSLATLRATPHAINVLTAPADGNVSIFCGDIAG